MSRREFLNWCHRSADLCNRYSPAIQAIGSVGALCLAGLALGVAAEPIYAQKATALAEMMSARAQTAQAMREGAMDRSGRFAGDSQFMGDGWELRRAAMQTQDFLGAVNTGCGLSSRQIGRQNGCFGTAQPGAAREATLRSLPPSTQLYPMKGPQGALPVMPGYRLLPTSDDYGAVVRRLSQSSTGQVGLPSPSYPRKMLYKDR